jgi:sensor histidine kinase YesM
VENSYDGNLVWNADGKLPVSSKLSEKMKSREVNVSALSEHGLGLKNVSELADKYFGGVQIETEDEVFRITVMLQW